MKNKNICKFPISNFSNELHISRFVFETDLKTMRRKVKLSADRLILIEQGRGTFSFDDVRYSFSAGMLFFGFEEETFYLHDGDDVRYFYIDFSGWRSKTLYDRYGIYPATRKIKNFNNLLPFYKNTLLNTAQESIDIAAESILLYTISQLSANTSAHNITIQKIIEISKERFNDPELSLAVIAKEVGYNAKYLSHFFKEKMNVSYSEYLRSIRFKYAISLFEHGLNSIKNVAYLSGFNDPLYFSGSFKKYIGLSPKDFIASLSEKDIDSQ